MCGFLFEYQINTRTTDHEVLLNLLSKSKLRGPDTSQFFQPTPNTWFGFNRLAIQDLSLAGNQPMQSNDQRYTLVFNGEIYNHLELRSELTCKNWSGHSDTETILQGIIEWGFNKTIEKLDGMFAISCYDKLEDTIYCARDFAGIKPFFYGWDGKSFIGASQYNQITQHPTFSNNEINSQVLRLYLEQHFMPAPFGLYNFTGQLEPGEIVKIKNSRLTRHKYWEFPEFQEPTIFKTEQALDLISYEFEQSVQAELISDVALGSFLSGGIDSPLVSYYTKKFHQKLNTFTIGSDSKVHDESADAALYSKLIDTNHNVKSLKGPEIQSQLREILNCVSEPMADFSVIPTYLVSKLAKEDVTVALSGDGGDELFFGYERFWSIAKNIKFQNWPWLIKAGLYKLDGYTTNNKRLNSVLLQKNQSQAHRELHSRFKKSDIDELFPNLKGVSTPEGYGTYTYNNTTSEMELVQKMRKAEFYGMMQKTLRKVDLASMGNSLEVRVPFLKKSFIEIALKIDPYLSYGNSKKKEILKNLLRAKLPHAPIDNRKRGFTVPLGKWLKDKDFMDQIIGNIDNLESKFGVDKVALNNMKKEHNMSVKDYKWPLFTVGVLNND